VNDVLRGFYKGVALCGPINLKEIELVDPPPSHMEVDVDEDPGWVHTYEAVDVDHGRRRIMYRYTGRWAPTDPAKPIPVSP
jgi:hypothetical protein